MSKIFYDHLIILEEVETEIKNISDSPDEKEELWNLVDDIVNHRMMITILDRLPFEHHADFLSRFHQAPHDEKHIDYLNERLEGNIEEMIKQEIEGLKSELLHEIKSLKPKR